ncbi:hypothetical protein P171DRAFT_491440 [Karstenula rhodostoma CBS 690.94]|uniref:Uncharacterized protein n=1 Tax=Karstenula rhodostoma CBS 690.94 TaxID=1392251 RepID=A0A9P4P641_9PLEO|nr:hypothetical protein P171DRAFT_491440 [Karstenula rhodostoma CBS 690.94]
MRHSARNAEDTSDDLATRTKTAAKGVSIQGRRDVFPFLDLPGELRNRIYDMLAEDAKENPVTIHKKFFKIKVKPAARKAASRNGLSVAHFNFGFTNSSWGMTQVYRKIQNELIPMLRPIRRVRVAVFELDDYMEAFNPRVDDLDPLRRTPGTIEAEQVAVAFDHMPLLQVWQLIQWAQASKDLQFVFDKHLADAGVIMDSFPRWKEIGNALSIQGINLNVSPESMATHRFRSMFRIHIATILREAIPKCYRTIASDRLVLITQFIHAAAFFSQPYWEVIGLTFVSEPDQTTVFCHGVGPVSILGYMPYRLQVANDGEAPRVYFLPPTGVSNTMDLEARLV